MTTLAYKATVHYRQPVWRRDKKEYAIYFGIFVGASEIEPWKSIPPNEYRGVTVLFTEDAKLEQVPSFDKPLMDQSKDWNYCALTNKKINTPFCGETTIQTPGSFPKTPPTSFTAKYGGWLLFHLQTIRACAIENVIDHENYYRMLRSFESKRIARDMEYNHHGYGVLTDKARKLIAENSAKMDAIQKIKIQIEARKQSTK